MSKSNEILIGIDLGGTNILAAAVTPKGQVLGRSKVKTKAELGAQGVVDRIVKAAKNALKEADVAIDHVKAAGIGAPGVIDFKTGDVSSVVNLRWDYLPLGKILKEQLGVPVHVDNDVNVGTWGEYQAGAAKGHDNLFGIFVGTGIGGGLIINGQLLHGHVGSAGEIGHTCVNVNGAFGRRTLENIASRTAVVNLITSLILANHPSCILDIVEGDLSKIRSKIIAQAIAKKDPLTTQVVRESANYVGIAIANTVTLLSLPCVVLGGGLLEALGSPYLSWVQESFEKNVFPDDLKKCKILPSKLGDDAGAVGAALLANNVFQK